MSSGYNVSGYQPFGSIGSFSMTWVKPQVLVDGAGNYTLLGTITQAGGGAWPANNSGGPWAQFGIYFAVPGGLKHGTYGQGSGQTDWIKSNWANIANGTYPAGAWFDPGGCAKYYDGNLPPIGKNGTFTLPGAWSAVTVAPWAVPKYT
jgi:hypothetical protein